MYYRDVCALSAYFIEYLRGGIGRAVIDNDYFEARIFFRAQSVKTGLYVFFAVVDGNYY
jgi:hypothetical protein